MNTRALSHIKSELNNSRFSGTFGFRRNPTANSLHDLISPVQFERIVADIRSWRNSIREIESPTQPARVQAMRMFIDVWENPHVKAVIDRYKELTTLRDYEIFQMKGKKKVVSDDLTQQAEEQSWLNFYIDETVNALLFGYSLIELGDIVDDKFPNITTFPRENIRPDSREGVVLTPMVHSMYGLNLSDDPLIELCNHWIPTKSVRGANKCGSGLLYNISLAEIHLRHILEWNADYVEMYGQPIKVGKTRKTGEDRDEFEAFLANSASNAYVLLDKGTEDEITYEMAQNAGTAWKSYENFEQRLLSIIYKLVLGHEDAMKSTPGKLGGMQAANKDGFNVTMVEQAMNNKQIVAGNFVCNNINDIAAPKFRKLGKYVGSKIIGGLFPEGYKFGLKNDKEENDIKRRDNADKLVISTWAKNLNDAGYNVDVKELSERIGLTLTEAPPEQKRIEDRTTKTEITRNDNNQNIEE
jgi:hypothetical protein